MWMAGWTVVVDRIEGDMAVLEFAEGDWIPVSVTNLPRGIEEGDRLRLRGVRCRRSPRPAVVSGFPNTVETSTPLDV